MDGFPIMRLKAGSVRLVAQIVLGFLLNFTVVGGLGVSQFLPILRLTAAVNPFVHVIKGEQMHLCVLGTVGRCLTGTWPIALLLSTLAGLAVVGLVLGRSLCGWACPFGLIQDLLAKLRGLIMAPRHIPQSWHQRLTGVKYLLLFLFTMLAITISLSSLANAYAGSQFKQTWPDLCRVNPYCGVCFPISINTAKELSTSTTPQLTRPYNLIQLAVLGTFFLGAFLVPRFWCRYFCWVGSVGSLFNRVSLLSIRNDRSRCTRCGYCLRACPMGNDLLEDQGDADRTSGLNCILCLRCVDSCPAKSLALHGGAKPIYTGGQEKWQRT
jgi:ferredoxin-type protein NapH